MNTGLKQAIKNANSALKHSSAYRSFLKQHKNTLGEIKNADDFSELPITDKKNFVAHYSLKELLGDGQLPAFGYASSGSSGQPTFWFRNEQQETVGGVLHEKIFKDVLGISKDDKVLVIICFSMGLWVAGNYTAASCRWLSNNRGYNLTTITPGIETRDILNILKNLSPNFDVTVIAGYPSFVMDILVETEKKGISLPQKTKLLTAGDSFSEAWRKQALNLIHSSKPTDIVSVYGSADAAVMGFETPLSIFIRQAALKDKTFGATIFKESNKDPEVVQYDPKYIFFESINGELILTANTVVPLIRYNIHDVGHVIKFSEIKSLLKRFNLLAKVKKLGLLKWDLPLIIKKGRTDVAVTFYALNIYPEHIQAGINHPQFKKILSGNFYAYNRTIKNQKQEQLVFEVELAEKAQASNSLLKKVANSIQRNLINLNMEYRKLNSVLGHKTDLQIKLVKTLRQPAKLRSKTLAQFKGKKPKIII